MEDPGFCDEDAEEQPERLPGIRSHSLQTMRGLCQGLPSAGHQDRRGSPEN